MKLIYSCACVLHNLLSQHLWRSTKKNLNFVKLQVTGYRKKTFVTTSHEHLVFNKDSLWMGGNQTPLQLIVFLLFALSQQQRTWRGRWRGVSVASSEYQTEPEPRLRLRGAWLAALNGTPVVVGRLVSERKLRVRRGAEGGGGLVSQAAGAELQQQSNVLAEPLDVRAIFSLLLSGTEIRTSAHEQRLSSRIVWNGMIGIISGFTR